MPGEPREIDEAWWTDAGAGARALPLGAPFRPGLDPIPTHQTVWAVVKDRWGRPAHGEPREALRVVRAPVPAIGPTRRSATCSMPGSPTTRSSPRAACPSRSSTSTTATSTCRARGAVVLLAALGSEVAREGRLRVGELCVLYPGVSNLLSPRAGEDPMHADFKIQGYETPDGSFAQFVRGQAPQCWRTRERLTLAEGSSFMLDLETVYKALYDVARVQPGERVFVEGAAGGTGIYAVACAALRGARVTGLVSTEDKGRLVARARRRSAYVNRKAPGIDGHLHPGAGRLRCARGVGRGGRRASSAACASGTGGALVDVVVSSVGRDLFARMVDLARAGRAPGVLRRHQRLHPDLPRQAGRRAGRGRCCVAPTLRPNEGVLVYCGLGDGVEDEVPWRRGDRRPRCAAGARVVVAARLDAQAARVKATHAVHGVVSLEALARAGGSRWPDGHARLRHGPRRATATTRTLTLKPFGQAVGRLLATADNPRGNPDVVVERAGQDTLGVSTFLARPFTGRVVYVEADARRGASRSTRRTCGCTRSACSSRRSRSWAPTSPTRTRPRRWCGCLDAGALARASARGARLGGARRVPPGRCTRTATPGRSRCAWGPAPPSTARAPRARCTRRGARASSTAETRARAARSGAAGRAELVALVTIDSPPPMPSAAPCSRTSSGRWRPSRPSRACARRCSPASARCSWPAPTSARSAPSRRAEEVEAFTARVQRLFERIGRLRAPVIAAVDGYALGGGNELQMACAWRVAAARAELGPAGDQPPRAPRLRRHPVAARASRCAGRAAGGRTRERARARAGDAPGRAAPRGADAAARARARGRGGARGRAVARPRYRAPHRARRVGGRALVAARRGGRPRRPGGGARAGGRSRASPPPRAITRRCRAGRPRAPSSRPCASGSRRASPTGSPVEAREFGRAVASEEGRSGIDRFLARQSWPLPLPREARGPLRPGERPGGVAVVRWSLPSDRAALGEPPRPTARQWACCSRACSAWRPSSTRSRSGNGPSGTRTRPGSRCSPATPSVTGSGCPARVRDEPYLNKPPLYFWSVALVSWPAGQVSERTAPIPSVIARARDLARRVRHRARLSGPSTGLRRASPCSATSPGFFLHSHQVLPDMALTAWLTWALYFLLRALRADRPRPAHLVGFYACVAGGALDQGHRGAPRPARRAAATWPRGAGAGIRDLRPGLGLAIVAVAILPWAIPYAMAPGHESSQSMGAGTAIRWYLDRYSRARRPSPLGAASCCSFPGRSGWCRRRSGGGARPTATPTGPWWRGCSSRWCCSASACSSGRGTCCPCTRSSRCWWRRR